MNDIEKAIEYFYKRMEKGLINNDTEQEVYEVAISALEKQIPKGIQKKVVGWKIDCFCPSCTLEVFSNQSYCSVCGQYLNWSQ